MSDRSFGLYIHWPFCLSKCPYCDFNSHVAAHVDHARWAAAYLKGLRHYAGVFDGGVLSSIYFGGGTPSLMSPRTVEVIIEEARKLWPVSDELEITLEANPTSAESGKLCDFKTAGVNRLSIGVQALNDRDLKFLGREHSADEALRTLEMAAGLFDRFSFDLIYARPGQTLEDWRDELKRALSYARGHLSLYQLTIEKGTPFYAAHRQGDFSIPVEGLAADFYDLTQDILEEAGMPAYEVSNHAVPGQESKHNLNYWRYHDYIGLGPGAHGRVHMNEQKFATKELSAPHNWLKQIEEQDHSYQAPGLLPARDRAVEALMMGLRLREGLDLAQLAVPWPGIIDEARLGQVEQEGLLSKKGTHIMLTRAGLLRLNAILGHILK